MKDAGLGRSEKARYRIMVMSGKGGVGKTTVAVNLALGLALYGRHVGLIDADITGPNVPKMLNVEDEKLLAKDDKSIEPVYVPVGQDHGIEMVSMAFIVDKDSPVVWRGPMKMSILKQFVQNVGWGDLDYLVIDLPPGTSDEPISIAQLLRPNGAVVVTTPSDLALLDAEKAVSMARAMKVPVLGVVENMSGFKCPGCGRSLDLFQAGGGQEAADRLGVPFLGRIEIDPAIVEAGDRGRPFLLSAKSDAARAFEAVVDEIVAHYEGRT